jgi:hypothetical protein
MADDSFDEAQRMEAIFRSPKVAQDLEKSEVRNRKSEK